MSTAPATPKNNTFGLMSTAPVTPKNSTFGFRKPFKNIPFSDYNQSHVV